VDDARRALAGRLEAGGATFLALIRGAVYARGSSPCARLLRHAGCAYADLERLVHTDAVEGAPRRTRGRLHGPLGPSRDRARVYSDFAMKVVLRNQGREVELRGRRRVRELLAELGVLPETVLVIRGRDLLTIDEVVAEEDVIELRPVISGGRA
jgi:sulfur carrier protein